MDEENVEVEFDDLEERDDPRRCPNCHERAIEKTPIAMGGGHTEWVKVCQMCGYQPDDES